MSNKTVICESNHNVLVTRHHIQAWKSLCVAYTEVTWWWTCLFETCRGLYNWNK